MNFIEKLPSFSRFDTILIIVDQLTKQAIFIPAHRLSMSIYSLYILQTQYLLQLKDLRVGQWEEPCIGLTQENLIENSVQDSLPYIPWTHGSC